MTSAQEAMHLFDRLRRYVLDHVTDQKMKGGILNALEHQESFISMFRSPDLIKS